MEPRRDEERIEITPQEWADVGRERQIRTACQKRRAHAAVDRPIENE